MWLTTSIVAKYLNVSVQTVNTLIHSGKLPARKIGRLWRVYKTTLEEYLDIKISDEEITKLKGE